MDPAGSGDVRRPPQRFVAGGVFRRLSSPGCALLVGVAGGLLLRSMGNDSEVFPHVLLVACPVLFGAAGPWNRSSVSLQELVSSAIGSAVAFCIGLLLAHIDIAFMGLGVLPWLTIVSGLLVLALTTSIVTASAIINWLVRRLTERKPTR